MQETKTIKPEAMYTEEGEAISKRIEEGAKREPENSRNAYHDEMLSAAASASTSASAEGERGGKEKDRRAQSL